VRGLTVLLLLLGGMASAEGVVAQECTGCHTSRRTEPQTRFANGLGRWTDSQCYGCHAEINDVAVKRQKREPDPRYFAVPVREDKLAHLATTPLSYMNAPELLEPPGQAVPRISARGLAAFLKRPSTLSQKEGSRAPRMMAYPSLQPGDVKDVARLLSVRLPAREAPAAKLSPAEHAQADALWKARCAACHSGPKPLSGRDGVALGLYTPEWTHAYSRQPSPHGPERQMPEVPLSLEEAKLLHRLFSQMRAEKERELDARVSQLALKQAASPAPVPPAMVAYLWGAFFRDATCVHCHATSPRAASAFTADAAGLKSYLRKKSGEEFWRRLETRALEAEHGLVAAKPGMPMAGVELPAELRGLVARWVLDGCKDTEGQSWCRR
jgi:mono/diheme cytochrome c family protein